MCQCAEKRGTVLHAAISVFPAELGNLPAEISRSSVWRFFKSNNFSAVYPILSRNIFLTDHGIRVFVAESVHMMRFASFYPRSQQRLKNVSLLLSQ